jgi:hypothetical protein
MTSRKLFIFAACWIFSSVSAAWTSAGTPQAVVAAPEASFAERLAAREIRRYYFLRTGRLLPLTTWKDDFPAGALIVVGTKARPWLNSLVGDPQMKKDVAALKSEEYLVKTLAAKDRQVLLVVGGDPIGTLYGAYRLAEALGMRFYLHGDVAPDVRLPAALPEVDLTGKPLFDRRGIQTYPDFAEGPDWWNADEYKLYLGQLPKLGMNFFGMHSYPECGAGPEPIIWVGPASEIGRGARVKASYPSRLFTTTVYPPGWGTTPTPTGEFSFGAADLFEVDSYGAEVMRIPQPWNRMTPEECNAVFERVGLMLRDGFTFARKVGVKTCAGTETPLTIPTLLRQRLQAAGKNPSDPAVVQEIYEGMFRRIMQTYPLDYYWIFTSEDWTWNEVKQPQIDAVLADLRVMRAAYEEVKPPFTPAVTGWVLGPPQTPTLFDEVLPKSMPMSCINRQVGNTPIEPAFQRIHGRPKWANPWLEDDPGLTMPQLWAGRMRRDAADALAYGCSGLFGIIWRTEILGPNVSALAKAAWDQRGWNPEWDHPTPEPIRMPEGVEGGDIGRFPHNSMAGTKDPPLYQVVRYNLKAYHLDVPDGVYTVTLKFCEPAYQEKGKRVFGVKLQGKTVIDRLDIFEKVGQNRALDYTFPEIAVTDGRLVIEFLPLVEFPAIAAIAVEGKTAEANQVFSRKINCGGSAYKDYAADLPLVGPTGKPRSLPADDFYADWARANFGPRAAAEIAAIFSRLDGRLPRPADWITGPGSIAPDARPWDLVAIDYLFVDELEDLAGKVEGPGNRQRFEYWLNVFRLLRTIAHVRCDWGQYNVVLERVKAEKDPAIQKKLARRALLPLREKLIASFAELHKHLLNSISTPGEMGNLANWQTQTLPVVLIKPGKELAQLLGEPLPPSAQPPQKYVGQPRLFVPTVRTCLLAGEPWKLKVIILGGNPQDAALYWRPLGTGAYQKIPLQHVARAVYRVTLPSDAAQNDFEYYLRATVGNRTLLYPATAPVLNQTVVVVSE